MKKWTLAIAIAMSVCLFLTACSNQADTTSDTGNENNTSGISASMGKPVEIVFPEQFEALSNYDDEKLAKYLKENSDGNYQKIECIDGQVHMLVTQEELTYWKNYATENVEKQKTTLTNVNEKYDAYCNDAYNTINMYFDQNLSFKQLFSYVGKTAIYCAMYQIFDGNPDYSLYLNIYNVDTGKLVVGANLMNEEVSFTDEDWEKSFSE